ncbi:MAG: hypothetical protein AAGF11_44325 [Myxococcota bacterium]
MQRGGRYVHWARTPLERLLSDRHDLRAARQNIIGTDLACKLRGGTGAEARAVETARA